MLGVRLSADSSKKTRQALRRWCLQNPWPALFDPAVDRRRLVKLGRPTRGPLHTPAEAMPQRRPYMRRIMLDPNAGGFQIDPERLDEAFETSLSEGLPILSP